MGERGGHLQWVGTWERGAIIRSGWARGREGQSFAVGGHVGERGSHSQWGGTRERGEVTGVIRSGRARGREVRWRQSFTVGGHGERGGGERSEVWLLMGQRGGEA